MTLFSYEIFDAVARQGSFNKAAQQLHLTPSAISHAIAVMEAELGFTLFNRGKNGVTMTSYGASLYPSIRAVRYFFMCADWWNGWLPPALLHCRDSGNYRRSIYFMGFQKRIRRLWWNYRWNCDKLCLLPYQKRKFYFLF